LYLTAAPLEPVEVPTLFEREGVVRVLAEPPTLRRPTVGWDLWTLDEPRFFAGRKASLANGYRKRVALYTGGTLSFVASCIEFLGWPRTAVQFVAEPVLNGPGLVEAIYNFALTWGALREHMSPAPARSRVWSGFRDLFLPSEARIRLGGHTAPKPSHDFPPLELEASDDVAASASYELVVQIFEWFGFAREAVPFVDHERGRLDLEALRTHLAGTDLLAGSAASA
jgi:hypothetical protein